MPFAPPEGWTVGNLSCDSDDGFNRQYHEGNPFCIGPFSFVTDIHPWGTPVPPAKTILHRLKRDGASETKGQTVAWWNRSGSTDNLPVGGYDTLPVIPTSPINPWERFDPMDIPLQPSPQVHPDPFPLSPYPGIQPRKWRSPTERTFAGPDLRPIPRRTIIIIVNPRKIPLRKRKGTVPRRWQPWIPPAIEIAIGPYPWDDYEDPRRPDTGPGEPGWYVSPGPVPLIPPPATMRPPIFIPGGHIPQPPPARVREKKGKLETDAGFAIVRALFETAFEAIDYVEAIYNSLPDNVKDWYRRYHGVNARTPIDKLRVIWKHHDLISLPEMINNLIEEEIQDLAFGILGKMSQIVARRLNLSVGPGFGQGSIRKHSRTIALELERMRDEITFEASFKETFR